LRPWVRAAPGEIEDSTGVLIQCAFEMSLIAGTIESPGKLGRVSKPRYSGDCHAERSDLFSEALAKEEASSKM
jgi:hypothetical protein